VTSASYEIHGDFEPRTDPCMPPGVGPAQVEAMLSVSRAVAGGGSLTRILDDVAAAAAGVVLWVKATSIILATSPGGRFRLAGSFGLSSSYRRTLNAWPHRLQPGKGPSGLAFQERHAVVIEDTELDDRIAAWRPIARREGYRALVSLPLRVDDLIVGTLNAYRAAPGPWSEDQVGLLTFFGDHAATAVRTAQLLDQQKRQVMALRRLVRGLRQQTHEHANRLHAVRGLLALGEQQEAQRFLEALETAHVATRDNIERRVEQPVLAGLLAADSVIAAQRMIALEIDESSSLARLPAALSDAQAVTILGNLLDNAFDAVAAMPEPRRRVKVRLVTEDAGTIIEVRDWGHGVDGNLDDPFSLGATTKGDHAGVGLALVGEAVAAAMGRIDVTTHSDGTSFTVTIPNV
jgi:GAF domain-containing protein